MLLANFSVLTVSNPKMKGTFAPGTCPADYENVISFYSDRPYPDFSNTAFGRTTRVSVWPVGCTKFGDKHHILRP